MMARYSVMVTRDCTESVAVEIEASSAAEAEALALTAVSLRPDAFEWQPDECSADQSEPYTNGADLCEADHCGQCEGTGTIKGGLGGDGPDEPCPVCDATGKGEA